MGRSFRFARLIGLAVVWEGQTRADIALKQVDHINRKRDDNSPRNLNFLEAMDDAGRSAQSQNTRSALLQGPSWLEKAEDAKGYSCAVRQVDMPEREPVEEWEDFPTAAKAAAATGIDELVFLKAIKNDRIFAHPEGEIGFELKYTCILDPIDGEQWKPSGRDRIDVSDHGRLRYILTKDDGNKLYLEKEASVDSYSGRRYLHMPLGDDDEVKKWFAKPMSHLVLECFAKGERRLGYEARHLNGQCDDDSLKNLEWGTHAVNENDKDRPSTHKGGACSFAECNKKGTITSSWTPCKSQKDARVGAGVIQVGFGTFASAIENQTPLKSPNGKYYRFRDDATPPPAERSDYEPLWIHQSHFHREPTVGLIQQFTTTHNMFRKDGATYIITDIENSYYDAIYGGVEDLSFRENTKEEEKKIHYKRLTVHYKRAALRDPVLGLGWRIADADEEATAAYVHEMDDCFFYDADADTEDGTSIAAQYEHLRTHGKKRKAPAPAPAPRAPRAPAPAPRVTRRGGARGGGRPRAAITYPCPASCGCGRPHRRCGGCVACRTRHGDACLAPRPAPGPYRPRPRSYPAVAPALQNDGRSERRRTRPNYAAMLNRYGPRRADAGVARATPPPREARAPLLVLPPEPEAWAAEDAAFAADWENASEDGASDEATPAAAPAPAPMDDENDDDDDDAFPEIPGTTI